MEAHSGAESALGSYFSPAAAISNNEGTPCVRLALVDLRLSCNDKEL